MKNRTLVSLVATIVLSSSSCILAEETPLENENTITINEDSVKKAFTVFRSYGHKVYESNGYKIYKNREICTVVAGKGVYICNTPGSKKAMIRAYRDLVK